MFTPPVQSKGGRYACDGTYRVDGIRIRIGGRAQRSTGFRGGQAYGGRVEDYDHVSQDGEKVADSFELKYELTKGSQAAHAHVFVDNQYQKGFTGAFKGLAKGTHQITVTGATKDHALVAASQTITIEVQ